MARKRYPSIQDLVIMAPVSRAWASPSLAGRPMKSHPLLPARTLVAPIAGWPFLVGRNPIHLCAFYTLFLGAGLLAAYWLPCTMPRSSPIALASPMALWCWPVPLPSSRWP